MSKSTIGLLILIICLTLVSPAQAYLDPGSGSGLLSIIIGFFVAIGLTIKTYWYKLKSLFTRSSKKPDESESSSSESSSDPS